MELFETLQRLSETAGPSGQEEAIAEVIAEIWQPYVDSVRRDRVGNLIAVKRGSQSGEEGDRRRLLIAAHMDELGLVVRKIEKAESSGYGFLRVSAVGGVDTRHLYGQQVTVHGRQPLRGLIGALPSSMLDDKTGSRTYDFDELVVDVGLPLDELEEVVSVGDFVSFYQPLRRLLNDRVAGKALDNRASVAALTVCLDYLQGRKHDWDLVAVATAQEETRLLGAYTSAFSERPDAAIAVDVTFGKGPGASSGSVFELADGPALGLGPNVHPGLYKQLKAAAEALEMKVHTDPHGRASGTDAYGLQIAREGVPTGLVGIPLRYMHTMVETVALDDVQRSGRLLGEFVARLDARFLDDIAKQMMDTE